MNNRSHSPVTEMLSGKYKIWLLVGLAVMFVVDLSSWVLLLCDGISAACSAVPCISAIMHLLYILGVLLSNQRFKYARSIFASYILVTLVLCAVWLVQAYSGSVVVFDGTVAVVWTVFHSCGIAAAVIAYVYAARLIRGGGTVQLVLAITASCVLVLGSGICYSVYLFRDGYFGQGGGLRPLTYALYDDGTCEVTGTVAGSGDSAVVPYEFNGYKVTKVSARLLGDGIKNVTLNCDKDAQLFYYDMGSGRVGNDFVINVNKADIDAVKFELYGRLNTRELGNRVFPTGLADDEVFITFDYDGVAIGHAGDSFIPSWFGKKGDVFDLNATDELPYVQRSDIYSDDDLYYCYNRYGSIMSELKFGDTPINGMAVNENCANVPVRFQKIYKILPGESNDGMYSTSDYFDFSNINGVDVDYKLTVAQNADRLLDVFDRGEGFTRTMYKKRVSGDEKFDSLKQCLQSSDVSEITIAPHWQLVQPTVNVVPQGASTDVYYGDAFSLAADIQHPILNELNLKYEWYNSTMRISYDAELSVSKAVAVGKAEYFVIITATAPDITALSAAGSANIYMNIGRRPLTVKWTDPQNAVYDGNEKAINAELENTVDGDDIRLTNSRYTQTTASTYSYSATLSGSHSSNYYIAEGAKHSFTVLPRPTQLVWDDVREFVYNGRSQNPKATAYDMKGEKLDVKYDGIGVNAGEHTVTATGFTNKNYAVDENGQASVKYKITPYETNVVWSNTELTYNGREQAPTPAATGVNGNLTFTVTGKRIAAGSGVAEAVLPADSGNYTLIGATCPFEIAKATVKVTVQDLTVEYGTTPEYDITIVGAVTGDDLKLVFDTNSPLDNNGNIAVGTYELSVTLSGGDSDNYTMRLTKSVTLTVTESSAEDK